MIADTFITATFRPGRSPCASAIRTTPTNGMGLYDLMGKQAVMADGKAIFRERVEKIDGVSRTWFEWLSRDSIPAEVLMLIGQHGDNQRH
jgi:hypothetical protein